MFEPIVLVHGGAGDIPVSRVQGKLDGCKKATITGYNKLMETGSVLDAVEEAVKIMELDEYFNAGYGSVLTCDGTIEMEASLMEYQKSSGAINAGCCTLVKNIMHPISLTRHVMKTPHNFLGGEAVNKMAKDKGFEILPEGALVTEYAVQALEEWKEECKTGDVKFARTEVGPGEVGTVGAVAIDAQGNIAVATSTGGITGKYQGRIGDTPVLGGGTFVNEFGGVSTTGHGETIMKASLATDILARIEYLKESPQEAVKNACEKMTRKLEGTGGAICIDKDGNIGIWFTSHRMAWAYQKQNELNCGIEKNNEGLITIKSTV